MEQPLRCNNQIGGYCRQPLTDNAVVTTCSHIFCLDCATKVGLAAAPLDERRCPTCQTTLSNTDDAVNTRLTPSDNYKTSVLSGLDPTTIMECAGRALAFWTYQTTQEVFYQEYMGKNLREKYGHLSAAMDKLVNEANSEIKDLQHKITSLSVDHKSLQDKYHELVSNYREKSRKQIQLQQMYDTLKKKVMQSQVETAASADVTQILESMNVRPRDEIVRAHSDRNFSPIHLARAEYEKDKINSEHFRQEILHPHQRSGSSGAGSVQMGMPPPQRPVAASRIPHPTTIGPSHRNALPGATHTFATPSQIPMSNTKTDLQRTHDYIPQLPGSMPVARHHNVANVTFSRAQSNTPRTYGGITEGVKIGRVSASADVSAQGRRFSR